MQRKLIDGSGKVLGFNGQIATNVVLGKAKALIDASTLTITNGGDLSVTAKNDARVDARLYSSGVSSQNGMGVSIAFNSVGWAPQNLLFNTLDTLLGATYL